MKQDSNAPLRDQAEQSSGYWRSLEHKDGHASVQESLEAEFPAGVTLPGGFNRRDALKLAGASMALGALTGCDVARRPVEEILPFVRQPEHAIPGARLEYATVMPRSEGAIGLLVEAHEGRPTKIEGNPNHPSARGASDIWAQAEVLRLYDPERNKLPLTLGQSSTWAKWDDFAKTHFAGFAAQQGKGLALLLEENDGPTVTRLLAALATKMPAAKVYRWDPLAPANAQYGAQLAFGPGARAHYDLGKAQVVFSLDADFLVSGPEHLALARQFGTSRAVENQGDVDKMKRLYVAEAGWSTTGTNADHRLRIANGQLVEVLKALAGALAQNGIDLGGLSVGDVALPESAQKFVAALAKDLAAHKGQAVVLVGDRQAPALHALGYALNVALGASGTAMTVTQGEPYAGGLESLSALVKSLNAGEVETLVIVDSNPVYTAPGGLKFAEALAKAKTVVHAGLFAEETGAKATWHLPLAHFLESWGDAAAWDGTASLMQPLILPLFGGRPAISVLAQVAQETVLGDRKLVEATWQGAGKPLADGKAWRRALHDGVVPSTARSAADLSLLTDAVSAAVAPLKGVTPSKDALEFVAIHGHPRDGRLTNVSWIMELPDTMSKLCWDNAVLMSPSTAKELGIESMVVRNSYQSDVVELSVEGRKLTAPTFVLPGVANHTLVLVHGFGRAQGEVAKGIGVDANPLLASGNLVQGVKLTKTGATTKLCSTQDHFSVPGNPLKELSFAQMSAEPTGAKERRLGLGEPSDLTYRPLYRSATATAFLKDGKEVASQGNLPEKALGPTQRSNPMRPKQLTQEIRYEGQQWGMVIDLSACIGCNICAIACVSENNIATVGREQVMLGRELHWMRIDRYFSGDIEDPKAVHQPVACMQCENAPCEPVCPVSATVHDEEGLNGMAYNRCIGTRYCSNNCPYKVRRFNYLDFTHTGDVYVEPYWKERMKTLKLQRNPDVTVRYRGVMEKCTFCTQRIEEAKIAAKRNGQDRKALPDGVITPACAQACPTSAITFGNINDETSKVAKLKLSDRNYEMLQELNIRPRTTYLARVRNENEELA